MTVPLNHQIAAVERETNLRRRVYPRLTDQKKITAEKAAAEIAAMVAVYATLRAVPLLVSACEELITFARNLNADPEMLDRCSAALRAAGSRI